MNEYPKIRCGTCKKPMLQKRPWQKYCSQTCRTNAFIEKHGRYVYALSPEQKVWKTQHAIEKQLSNPGERKHRDRVYRESHRPELREYAINYHKTHMKDEAYRKMKIDSALDYYYDKVLKLPKPDILLKYEMEHEEPSRAFIPIPEQYHGDVKKYFDDGIVILNDILRNTKRKRLRA